MEDGIKSELGAQAVAVCLCFHSRKAARAITQIFDHALATTGLKATQLSVLMVINDCDSLTVGQLAQALVTDSTTASRGIKPLISAGLIAQTIDTRDRRVKHLSLTHDGYAALENALPFWQDAQSRVARSLGGAQVQRLLPGLEAVSCLISDKNH